MWILARWGANSSPPNLLALFEGNFEAGKERGKKEERKKEGAGRNGRKHAPPLQ